MEKYMCIYKIFFKTLYALFLGLLLRVIIVPLLSFFNNLAYGFCELLDLTKKIDVSISSRITLTRDLFGVY